MLISNGGFYINNLIEKSIGIPIGKLTIIGKEENYSTHNKYYKCECSCGNQVTKHYNVLYHYLRDNSQASCGCLKPGTLNKGKQRKDKAQSHIGEKHNRLTIHGIDISHTTARGYFFLCKCDCGNITRNRYSELASGKVKSCGCWQKEQASITGSFVGLNNGTINCSKRNWGINKDGNFIRMRSGYEVMYALVLEKENINWVYEPKRIKLSNGLRYTPDFYLPDKDLWIDVKGQMTEKHKSKHKLFTQLGHKLELVFIDEIVRRLGIGYIQFKRQWDMFPA